MKFHNGNITHNIPYQGRIQVLLWGGGEFQMAELMYILGKIKI